MKTILALGSMLPPEMTELENHFRVIRLRRSDDADAVLREQGANISAILSFAGGVSVSARLIGALPNLEIVSQFGVGVDNIDLAAAAARDIAVTNTPDVLTEDTADTALALLLAVTRRVCEADMYVRVGKWRQEGPMGLGTSLSGKKAGIVGLGRIGAAIARRLEAFNIDVAYYGPRRKPDAPYRYHNSIEAMAAEVDFLIVAAPAMPATLGLVDYKILELLGPKGFLINIARGSIVVESDLLAALSNRVIAGAGLDVFAHEPDVPEGLFSMDNVVLLPHIGSATTETRTRMGRLVIENLLAHFAGSPLPTPVKAGAAA
jgi:lactate dehydrogenase-like 2-hydroxyacid dehydrogenase